MTPQVVEKYVGIPWVLSGADFKGVDCWGLVRLFFREEYGYALPQTGRGNAFRQVEVITAGDVAMYVGRTGWHTGIVTPWGLLHVREGQLSRITPLHAFRHMKTIQYFRRPA